MRLGTLAALIGICVVTVTAAVSSGATQIETELDATTVTGTGSIAEIHAGSCDERERDALVAELAPFDAPSGGHLGSNLAAPAVTSFTPAIPFSLDQLLTRLHVVHVLATGEHDEEPLACGEIAGGLTIDDELVIGLREEGASGFTGIAYLVANQANASRTNIAVFVAENLIAAAGADQEQRVQSADAGVLAPGDRPSAGEVQQDPPDPLASWRLDETRGTTAADATGRGFAGAYGEGVGCGDSCANAEDNALAARFDGSGNAYVDMSDVLDFAGQTPFSIEAWIAPTKLPAGAYPRIVQKEGADADRLRQGYVLVLIGDTGQVGFERWRDGAKEAAVSPCPIPTDTPVHVVATYDSETMRVFVNGIQVASALSTEDLLDTPFPFRVGNSSEGTSPFEGNIAEVAVYDVALDPDSVSARYGAVLDPRSWPRGPLSADVSCP